MIQDRIKNGKLYAKMGSNFAEAFAWLEKVNPAELTPGRIEVKGEEIYALVQQYTTKPLSQGFLETHKRYADIQVVLKGSERMGYCFNEGLSITQPYTDEKDVEKYEYRDCSQLIVNAGNFALFLPDDAHAPQLAVNEPAEILKIVMKVKV